ncbi:unnamed protein product [Penicillium olsonii]|uniref:Uncharacterized protein n=1 Tax=Penicillium olsonii TaxID=99116 RepID=A0A9W4HUA7_PENOL|nr:unnamed protein product [Penicillium olsonii]
MRFIWFTAALAAGCAAAPASLKHTTRTLNPVCIRWVLLRLRLRLMVHPFLER